MSFHHQGNSLVDQIKIFVVTVLISKRLSGSPRSRLFFLFYLPFCYKNTYPMKKRSFLFLLLLLFLNACMTPDPLASDDLIMLEEEYDYQPEVESLFETS